MEPQLLREIEATLFPGRLLRPVGDDGVADELSHGAPAGPDFSVAEVDRFRRRNRVPGPDGIPNRVCSVVHAIRPAMVVQILPKKRYVHWAVESGTTRAYPQAGQTGETVVIVLAAVPDR